MTIDKDLILKLENLSKLELQAEEREALRQSLNKILAMIDQLNEVPTDGVEPLVYVSDATPPPREDRVAHQLDRADALRNAPDHNQVFFKVPKVLDIS